MPKYSTYKTLDTLEEVELLEIPSGYIAEWTVLFVSNSTSASGDTSATINIYDKRDPDTGEPTDYLISIADEAVLTPGEYVLERDFTFILQPGQIVTAKASREDKLRVALTFELLEAPATLINFTGAPKQLRSTRGLVNRGKPL